MSEDRIYGFAPVFRQDAKILICGSMPSVASLECDFYYGHPRNAFWKMMAEIFDEPTPVDIEAKKDLLISRRIALWDSVASCCREGSLDSAIRNVVPNDFEYLYRICPEIGAVLFNGATAMDLYHRSHKKTEPERRHYKLPSTSPAYTLKYEKKKDAWQKVIMEVLHK